MPRHTFRIPPAMRIAVQKHVEDAVRGVDPRRFGQEAPYVAALAHAIEGVAYDGTEGKVLFSSTVFDDRGRNSAERRLGADLAITAEIEREASHIRKAILVQAKLGPVNELPAARQTDLHDQIRRA